MLRCFAAQSGDCRQQLPAMTDRGDAEADQIIGGQLAQDLAVDVVGGERRSVVPETEPAEPIRDVNRHCLPRDLVRAL